MEWADYIPNNWEMQLVDEENYSVFREQYMMQ